MWMRSGARCRPARSGRPSCGGGCAPGSACRARPSAAAGPCERLTEDPSLAALPARLSLFGLTRLPAGHLEVLRALARGRDVHLFLLHPSDGAVDRRRPGRLRDDRPGGPPVAGPHGGAPGHPLLASWGRDAREMQLVLAGAGGPASRHRSTSPAPAGRVARGLLGAPPGRRAGRPARRPARRCPTTRTAAPALDPDDRSMQVHACHGRARQVEVVRDAILHALAEDPTLEPRDVIVMCPDIETFAPLIQATFGAGETATEETARGAARQRRAARRPARPPGRPLAAPDQPAAGRRRPSCSSWPSSR